MKIVVLSGGAGTRLWPMSRALHPKQFLPLLDDKSLLQDTLLRVKGLSSVPPLLVCNEEHRFLAAEQLRQIDIDVADILLEPVGRNTAPAIALAALATLESSDDVLLVLPADHYIEDEQQFRDQVCAATSAAEAGALVTFGVQPDHPETGYGYIKAGVAEKTGGMLVDRFVEKPDEETAATYLEEGGYYWNSGMFMFKASVYLEELKKFRPSIYQCCVQSMRHEHKGMDFIRVDDEAFRGCESDSIDYAVMEQTQKGVMFPLTVHWNDVGSWKSLLQQKIDLGRADEQGNVLHGDVVAMNSHNNYLRAEHRLLATVGVEDLIVVETADAVLVAAQSEQQQVKSMVVELDRLERPEAKVQSRVFRPWGFYESVASGKGYQVKRISVKSGASLSLQSHQFRAEHWVVVQGCATVTNGKVELQLHENQSTYIPIGERHRLANHTNQTLELIEVQSGTYLGEDDIVRFDDEYGR